MHSMLRQNQIRLQDIKAYVRTCDRQNKLSPEEWAKQESNIFDPGTLVFLLEPAKRPPGLTSFAAKSQPASEAAQSETFRVKDLSVVIDKVDGKSRVLNVTPSAFELRLLETLFQEKAMKAILEGIDFNYLIASPRTPLDENGEKEIRQLAQLYGNGGSRRSLTQNPSGPEEPAKAILGFLGVDWSKGGNKPVIELGSVCHFIFAPEGQEESPIRDAIKTSFTPILANEKLGGHGKPEEQAAQPKEEPQAESSLPDMDGLQPVKPDEGSVFAPVDLDKKVSEGGQTSPPKTDFGPIDQPKQEDPVDKVASEFAPLETSPSNKEEFLASSVPPGSLMTQEDGSVTQTPTADAPYESQEVGDYVPAWYLLTHDLKEMHETGKKQAEIRAALNPKQPEEKVDYSNQFKSDFDQGAAGNAAIQEAEQIMQQDAEIEAQAFIPADADEAVRHEEFNDALFAESGAKSSLEYNPDAKPKEKEPEKPVPSTPPPVTEQAAPQPIPDVGEGGLFEKLTAELTESTPNSMADIQQPNDTTTSAPTSPQSGPPTNLMDMLTADSEVFSTSSDKPAIEDLIESTAKETSEPGAKSDNYNDLADALNGLIDSDSIPSTFDDPKTAKPDPSQPAPVSFNMDVPQALTESGSYPVQTPEMLESISKDPLTEMVQEEPTVGQEPQQPVSKGLFDDDEDFEESIESVADAVETSEINAIKLRPELTLTEGQGPAADFAQPLEAEVPAQSEPLVTQPPEAEVPAQSEPIVTQPPEAEVPAQSEPIVTQPPEAEVPAQSEPIVTQPPEAEVPAQSEPLITQPPEAEVPAQSEPIVTQPPEAEVPAQSEPLITQPPEAEVPAQSEPIVTHPPEAEVPAQSEPIVTHPPEAEVPAQSEPIVTQPPEAEVPVPQDNEPILTAPPAKSRKTESVPFPEPIEKEEEPAAKLESVPFTKPIVTEPPQEEAPVAKEPIVTQPPVVEEPVAKEPIVTQPPVVEEPVAEEPIVTQPPIVEEPVAEEPIVTQPPVVEEPVAKEPIVTQPTEDPKEASLFPHKPEFEEEDTVTSDDTGDKTAKAPLLKPTGKRPSRLKAAKAAAAAEVEAEIPEEIEPVPEPVKEEPVQTGPSLEPKLVISESARFMARLNQRLSEADKKLSSKADSAKELYESRLNQHIEHAQIVERDRANNSLGVAAKLTRELESVASSVRTRIEETAAQANDELSAVINEAEQEMEQVKQEMISTLRYAEHRARSDSDSLKDDSSKKLDNHIQERTQEFNERTEYVCSLLENAANEHIKIAENDLKDSN